MATGIEVSALSALFMRVTGLLERADDAEAIDFDFEVMVLNRYHNVLFDRSAEAVRIEDRLKLLNSKSGPTFESRFTEGLMMMFEACDKIGLFGGEITLDLQGWLEGSIRMAHAWAEACQLSESDSWNKARCSIAGFGLGSVCSVCSCFESWNPDGECPEDELVESLSQYGLDIDGSALKEGSPGGAWSANREIACHTHTHSRYALCALHAQLDALR